MEIIPKLLARQFRWFADISLLIMCFMYIGSVLILPVLGLILFRVDGYLVIIMLSLYLVCLVGMLAAKYYYINDSLVGLPVLRSRKKHTLFLIIVYSFLSFAIVIVFLPIIYK